MPARAFPTFAEASAFAKNIAQEHKTLVHIVRRGAEFVVESKVALEFSKRANERVCIECGAVIPPERVKAIPAVSRCLKCQSSFEQTHDTRRRINEGLAGTREGHKKMRGKLWGEMRKRSRDQ